MAGHGDETTVDLSPVCGQDPLDLRISLSTVVHWADSREVRLYFMEQVAFPADDVSMFLVVNQLSYRGALRPTDLAAAVGTGKANISKIVRRLEELDLVVRAPAPFDERSTLVALAPAGREIGRKIMDVAAHQLGVAIEGWSDEDVRTFRRLVARFARQATAETARRLPPR